MHLTNRRCVSARTHLSNEKRPRPRHRLAMHATRAEKALHAAQRSFDAQRQHEVAQAGPVSEARRERLFTWINKADRWFSVIGLSFLTPLLRLAAGARLQAGLWRGAIDDCEAALALSPAHVAQGYASSLFFLGEYFTPKTFKVV